MSRGKRGRVICEPGTTSTESRSVLYRAHCCSVSSRGRVPQPLTLSVTHFPFIICPLCIRASTFRIAHARYRSKRISFAKPSFLRFSTRNETPRRVLITYVVPFVRRCTRFLNFLRFFTLFSEWRRKGENCEIRVVVERRESLEQKRETEEEVDRPYDLRGRSRNPYRRIAGQRVAPVLE